jgi:hypothetical protein
MKEHEFKMVLLLSHRDSYFLEKTTFLDFLKALAIFDEVDFWYDKEAGHKSWDEKTGQQLKEADIIVLLLTRSFLRSRYLREVKARIASERRRKGRLLIVPLILERLKDSDWKQLSWLNKYPRLPKDGVPILPDRSQDLAGTFKEIIDDMRRGIKEQLRQEERQRESPSLETKYPALYTLRRVTDLEMTDEERELLIEDAERRAQMFVRDAHLRQEICQAAKILLKKNKGQSLSKEQLEQLDERFLRKRERRKKPDPKKIRWVLRAARLHPQGRRLTRMS